MRSDKMRLGLSIRGMGYHVAAWRHPDQPAAGALDYRQFLAAAQAAERGLFDMVFLADTLSQKAVDLPPGAAAHSSWNAELDPLMILAALAPLTRNIGLAVTMSTSYNEPFNVARRFSSLDFISGGRAAWNMVTSWGEDEAKNFGVEPLKATDARYARGREFLEVVCKLWDSWRDGALLADKAAGLFYDYAGVQPIRHRGAHFACHGPATIPRTPQGRPIIIQAGGSDQGREIAASTADVIYAVANSMEDAQAYYSDVKGRMARYGRDPDHLKIMYGMTVFLGRTEAEAREKYEELQSLIDLETGLSAVMRLAPGLMGHPLDEPVTDIAITGFESGARRLREVIQRDRPTLRELTRMVGHGVTQNLVIGTPVQVADHLERWFQNHAADGFNFMPARLPAFADDLTDLLVPELQNRKLFRTRYESDTLRGNLGLPWPAQPAQGA